MNKPALSKTELTELLDALSQRLRRRRTVAKIYVIGGACMALAYGRGRSTEDVDARIDSGHGALTEAAREIARERGLAESWLNEQATSAIPRTPDRRAQTLYESPNLVVTGASAEYLLAMKLEAARDKDVEDIAYLLERLHIGDSDKALAIHEAVLPESQRRGQARALLGALAAQTPGLTAPTRSTETEQKWLAVLAGEGSPHYEYEETAKGLRLTVQTTQDGPRQVLGEGLRAQGAALIECGHRGWPKEAVDTIIGFRAAELARTRALNSTGATAQTATTRTTDVDNTGGNDATDGRSDDETGPVGRARRVHKVRTGHPNPEVRAKAHVALAALAPSPDAAARLAEVLKADAKIANTPAAALALRAGIAALTVPKGWGKLREGAIAEAGTDAVRREVRQAIGMENNKTQGHGESQEEDRSDNTEPGRSRLD